MGPTCHREEGKRFEQGEADGWGRCVRERGARAARRAGLLGLRAGKLAGLGPVGPVG